MERIEDIVIVKNVHGLHARPAAVFVQLANKFDSWVLLEKDGERVDGKSIIAILSLGVHPGAEVKLVIEGADALDAFNELKKFLESGND
jgi:phosphotransferase system HPr (HPr) family protein